VPAAVLVELAAVVAVAIMEKVIEGFVCTAAIAAAVVIAVVVIAAAAVVAVAAAVAAVVLDFAADEIIDMLNLVLVPAAAVAFHCVFETMMICPY